jgi:trimethylamine--corrinoid protein Co-methyltransferase
MLAQYQEPPLDVAVDDALQDFIRQKKESMSDQWY